MKYFYAFLFLFFTFSSMAQSPGGQSGNLRMWLKANAGVSTSVWNDQTSNNNDFSQYTSSLRPSITNNIINFNPAYYFDGGDYFNGKNRNYRRALVYFVIRGENWGNRSRLLNNNSYSLRYEQWNNTGTLGFTRYSIRDYNSGISSPFGQVSIISFEKSRNSSNVLIKKIVDGVSSTNNLNTGSSNSRFPLNEYGRYLQGYTAEVIFYDNTKNSTAENRIESYLAIKYGVTLHSNYVHSGGTTIWNRSGNSGYLNDVAGIGRDDTSGLNQGKSKSVNSSSRITIANGTNISSPASFTSNRSFLLWGHNDGSTNSFSQTYYGQANSGIARKWKVNETGSVGNVRLQIAKSTLPSGVNRLLVSTNASFPNNASTQMVDLIDSGSNWEATVNFSNNQYFTFYRHNLPPVLSTIESADLEYCDGSVLITNTITASDTESDLITATITISSGFESGQDELEYSSVPGVTISSSSTQTIVLNAASPANMGDALQAISFRNDETSGSLVTGSRTITFTVNDGNSDSNQLSRNVLVNAKPNPVGVFHE